MSVQEEASVVPAQERKKAPWMNMPGAPPRPNFAEYGAKLTELAGQRRALVDEIKQLQSSVQGDTAGQALNAERNAFREKLNGIDAKRKVLRERRAAQDAEIAKVRKHRAEVAEQLRNVQAEVGGFKSVKEIDQAIDYMMRKMESSGGGLVGEKRNQQRINLLEQAKAHLLKLQPLTEAIKEITDQETVLQQEYLAISEQIGIQNKEYEEELQKKRVVDKEAQTNGSGRSEVYKKCDEIRTRVDTVSQAMDAVRAEREQATATWDNWNKEAREKYFAQLEEQREKRRKEYEERRDARKLAAKKARAVERQNPYIIDISACSTLIQYLKQKKVMMLQDEENRKKREAAARFDPTQVAPTGYVVLNDSKPSAAAPLSKLAKKQQKQQQQQKQKAAEAKAAAAAAAAAAADPAEPKDRMLQHSEDKIRLFQMIEVEPALSLATIDEKIHQIEEKRASYEAHVKKVELELSSGDDEEDEDRQEHGVAHDDAAEEKEEKPEEEEKPAAEEQQPAPANAPETA